MHVKGLELPAYDPRAAKICGLGFVSQVSLFGQNVIDDIISILSRILKNYEIIHTSGLLIKKKKLFYECYLNLNLSDIKSKELKASLDKIKIKKIFMEVKIEEISIEKSKKYIK
jgi:hypothetical protein